MDIEAKNDIGNSHTMKSDGIPVLDVAKLNAMNTVFAYLPRRENNKYSGKRVNKPYNSVLDSKEMVQNISHSKDEVILFAIMR